MNACAQRLVARVAARLRNDEDGFTLIEMLNVMLIMGILMSISVSAFTTLHARAEKRTAQANVSAILPAVREWRADNGTYAGMTIALLNSLYLNGAIDVTYYDVGPTLTDTFFCVQYTVPTGAYIAKADALSSNITVGPGNICT